MNKENLIETSSCQVKHEIVDSNIETKKLLLLFYSPSQITNILLAKNLLEQDNTREAIECYIKAEASLGKLLLLRLETMSLQEYKDEKDKLHTQYSKLYSLYANCGKSYLLDFGERLMSKGALGIAEKAYVSFLPQNKEEQQAKTEHLCSLAEIHIGGGRLEVAERIYNTEVGISLPKERYLEIGDFYVQRGLLSEAQVAYKKSQLQLDQCRTQILCQKMITEDLSLGLLRKDEELKYDRQVVEQVVKEYINQCLQKGDFITALTVNNTHSQEVITPEAVFNYINRALFSDDFLFEHYQGKTLIHHLDSACKILLSQKKGNNIESKEESKSDFLSLIMEAYKTAEKELNNEQLRFLGDQLRLRKCFFESAAFYEAAVEAGTMSAHDIFVIGKTYVEEGKEDIGKLFIRKVNIPEAKIYLIEKNSIPGIKRLINDLEGYAKSTGQRFYHYVSYTSEYDGTFNYLQSFIKNTINEYKAIGGLEGVNGLITFSAYCIKENEYFVRQSEKNSQLKSFAGKDADFLIKFAESAKKAAEELLNSL